MKNIEEPWKYLHEQIRATETEFGHLPRRTGWKKYFKQNPLEFKTHRRKNAAESQRKQSYILVDVFSTCFHSRKHRTLENRKKNMKTKPNIWSIVETSTSHCCLKIGDTQNDFIFRQTHDFSKTFKLWSFRATIKISKLLLTVQEAVKGRSMAWESKA